MSSVVVSWLTGTVFLLVKADGVIESPYSSVADSFTFDVQEEEENFDLALIASLEIDVVPHLGDSRVPDYLITHLAKILQQGSQLREYDPEEDYMFTPITPMTAPASGKGNWAHDGDEYPATINPTVFVSRERFSYWCFDLLFLICSDVSKGLCSFMRLSQSFSLTLPADHKESRKRVAALSLSSLLGRCRTTLAGYAADESLRGSIPFPRYVRFCEHRHLHSTQ